MYNHTFCFIQTHAHDSPWMRLPQPAQQVSWKATILPCCAGASATMLGNTALASFIGT